MQRVANSIRESIFTLYSLMHINKFNYLFYTIKFCWKMTNRIADSIMWSANDQIAKTFSLYKAFL